MIDMYKYLYEFIAILAECKIRYFLTSGTLLGVIRESDFIAGDLDIDIGVFVNDLTPYRLKKLSIILKNKNWVICRDGKDVVTFRPFAKESFHIDCWKFRLYKNLYFHYGWAGRFIWPRNMVEPLTEIKWKDKMISVPCLPEEYLATLYGASWKIPQNIGKPYGFANYKEGDVC